MFMNRGGIIRIIIYAFIIFILVYFSIGYSYEIYCTDSALINASDTHDTVVDNTDFTLIVMLFGYGVNGVLIFITQVVYAIIILVASALLVTPFRLIGLNKKRKIIQTEYAIYKYSFIGIFVLSLIVNSILTRFTGLLTVILYNGIWAVFVLLLVVLPAGKLAKMNTDLS